MTLANPRRLDTSGGLAQPLYERLKTIIRDKIASGEYPPRAQIPSTAALAQEFDVSVITVRRAVHDLITEGRLKGQPGLGVFVSAATQITRSLGHDFVTSLGERMRMQGVEPGLRQLSLELVLPTEPVREALSLARRAPVYRHDKLILADGLPVSVDTTHIPRALGKRWLDDIPNEFLLELLIKHDVAVGSVDYRMEARGALEQEAVHLGAPVGSPLLSVRYIPRDPTGKAIFVGETRSRPDWFAYEFHIPVPSGLAKPRN